MIDDIHNAAFSEAIALIKEINIDHEKWENYLGQLLIYSANRKKNLFDINIEYVQEFDFDINLLLKNNFEILPNKIIKPLIIHFYASSESTSMIEDQIRVQGSDLNGISKIISRIPVSKLQRHLKFDSEVDVIEVINKNTDPQFITPTAISPGEFS